MWVRSQSHEMFDARMTKVPLWKVRFMKAAVGSNHWVGGDFAHGGCTLASLLSM